MKIIKSYKGLKLYAGVKSKNGFYREMLASLHNLFAFSRQTMKNPKVLHFVLAEPAELVNLSKYLERWRIKRIEFNQELSSVKYFGSVETRPRNKQRHLHLCIVADSIQGDDLPSLKEMLQGFSLIKACSLQYRKSDCLRLVISQETGEIPTNKINTDHKRMGSTKWHKLRDEFEDVFQRFSYITKVETKTEPKYICSRLLKPKETKQHDHPQSKTPTLLPLVQADFPRSDHIQHAQRSEWMPQPALDEDDGFESQSVRNLAGGSRGQSVRLIATSCVLRLKFQRLSM